MENNSVLCQLIDSEGESLGPPTDLPLNVTSNQLRQLVNQRLNNDEALPYAFYISDRELISELGSFLREHNVSVETVVQIVYQPQAVFRTRPVNRCSAQIRGHTDAVLAVGFSPDGKHLASCSGDTSVRLWDLNTQTPFRTCTGHRNWVLCLAWSPDAMYLVTGSKSGEILCWDPQTGEFLCELLGHKKWINCISTEPLHRQAPSRLFVSASKDGDARVWDVVLRRCVMCLSGHTHSVTCVKWGGDGLIYTGSEDGTIKVWNPSNQGMLVRELQGHSHWINCLSLSTDHAIRTGAFGHTGREYDSPEEKKEAALAVYNEARGNAPERLASGSDDFTVIIWEPLVNSRPLHRLTGHQQPVNDICYSPNGKWLASASFDKKVKLWNPISGNFVAVFGGHVASVYQIRWSPDSRFLVSASKDSTLKVWDIRTRALKHDLPGHSDEVNAVDWSPDGEKVASGGKDKLMRIYM